MDMKIRFNVKWDGAPKSTPRKFTNIVSIPNDIDIKNEDMLDDYLSDWLSDTYGYCHLGFAYSTLN